MKLVRRGLRTDAKGRNVLLIDCPYCGPRAEVEFDWGGESNLARPGPHDAVSEETWAEYLFFRKNERGAATERWRHSHGCRQWFNIERDTATHKVIAVYRMGEPRPAPARKARLRQGEA